MELSRRSQLALGLAGAVTLGIALGSSAVSAIDPVYFRGPPSPPRPYTAMAQAGQPETPFYGGPFHRSSPEVLQAALCPSCPPQPAASAAAPSAPVPYFGSREERAAVEAGERRAIDDAYAFRERTRESRQAHTGMGGPLIEVEDEAEADDAAEAPVPDEEDSNPA